jgi:hypothetical protein
LRRGPTLPNILPKGRWSSKRSRHLSWLPCLSALEFHRRCQYHQLGWKWVVYTWPPPAASSPPGCSPDLSGKIWPEKTWREIEQGNNLQKIGYKTKTLLAHILFLAKCSCWGPTPSTQVEVYRVVQSYAPSASGVPLPVERIAQRCFAASKSRDVPTSPSIRLSSDRSPQCATNPPPWDLGTG